MEIESKYIISRDRAEAIIYKAGAYKYKIDGVFWRKDEYFSNAKNPKEDPNKFRLRKELLYKASIYKDASQDNVEFSIPVVRLDSCINAFLDDSTYDYPSVNEDVSTNYFTYKNKHTEDGFEVNVEHETEVSDEGILALEALFDSNNMTKYFSKYKKTFSFYVDDNYHVELVNFKNYYWMEIEYVSDREDKFSIMRNIEGICNLLGVPLENRDTRDWSQIEKHLDEEK